MVNRSNMFFLLGKPLGPFYSALMSLRSQLYINGVFRSTKLDVPVISIGNLTMGGTGKTPTVQYLADLLKRNGYEPAIISRGYGGRSKAKTNVVSNKNTLLMNAEEAGDEPRFLAESLPQVPVVTGKLRIHPCLYAIQKLQANVLILDDGFQHLSVQRDIDLVLFNSASLQQPMSVFPGGYLREPLSALSRASAIVITGASENTLDDFNNFSKSFPSTIDDRPLFLHSYSPQYAKKKGSNTRIPLEQLPSSLYGFCGIASPHRFRKSLEVAGLHLKGFTTLRDHQPYTPPLLQEIEDKAINNACTGLITTEKDMVKLSQHSPRLPLYTIVMKVTAAESFDKYILDKLSTIND